MQQIISEPANRLNKTVLYSKTHWRLNYDTLETYVLITENNYHATFHENLPIYSQSP